MASLYAVFIGAASLRGIAGAAAAEVMFAPPKVASAATASHSERTIQPGLNTRNPAIFEALHHSDMVAHIVGIPRPMRGRDDLAAALKGMITAFPDVHIANDPYPIQFGERDWITVVSRNIGTFCDNLTLPGGKVIHGTGKRFDVDFTTSARWQGDRVIEEWMFWATALVNMQIGLD